MGWREGWRENKLVENRGARRESVGDTRLYNEILIPPFDFDFLEKRSMEIKLPATTVRRHNKSTAVRVSAAYRTKFQTIMWISMRIEPPLVPDHLSSIIFSTMFSRSGVLEHHFLVVYMQRPARPIKCFIMVHIFILIDRRIMDYAYNVSSYPSYKPSMLSM